MSGWNNGTTACQDSVDRLSPRATACGIMEDSLSLDVFIYICTLFRPTGPFVPNSIVM